MGLFNEFVKNAVRSGSVVTAAAFDLVSTGVRSLANLDEDEKRLKFENQYKKYADLYNRKQYKQALKQIEKMRSEFGDSFFLYIEKADTLISMGEEQMSAESGDPEYEEQVRNLFDCHNKAKVILDSAEQYVETLEEQCKLLYWRSRFKPINFANGGPRKYLIGAMATDDEGDRELFTNEYNDWTSIMRDQMFEEYKNRELLEAKLTSDEDKKSLLETIESEKFTNIDYVNRQFIFIGRDENRISGCYDDSGNINWVFSLEYIPSDIKFPVGHPQANTLYVAHPVNKEIYIPYEDSSYHFFIDKIHELCYLLQCLGATEISFRSLKGKDASMAVSENDTVGGEFGNKKVGFTVGGQVGIGSSQSSSSSHKSEMGLVITSNPTTMPYCPDDLHWMNTETQWKNLVKQRLAGNLLKYEQRISTKSMTNISSSQKLDIKGAFDHFMCSVSANYNGEVDTTFSESEETEWQINAKFKPLEDFAKNVPNFEENADSVQPQVSKLTKAEEEYLEEFKFCLEDGEIGPKERRFLTRMQEKLGVSSERVRELEEAVTQIQLTDEEKEYVEAVKDEIENGCIPESSKRLLLRLRKRMGISDGRANELDSIAIGVAVKD